MFPRHGWSIIQQASVGQPHRVHMRNKMNHKCAHDGCRRKARSSISGSLCGAHYQLSRRKNNPKKCVAVNCKKGQFAGGYCVLHYGRSKRHLSLSLDLRLKDPSSFGTDGERKVARILRIVYRRSVVKSDDTLYDLLVDGTHRVEVKTARLRMVIKQNRKPTWMWSFNILRGGKINEKGVHFYVFLLKNVPLTHGDVYLLVRAPIGRPTVYVTPNSLCGRWYQYSHNFRQFASGKSSNFLKIPLALIKQQA